VRAHAEHRVRSILGSFKKIFKLNTHDSRLNTKRIIGLIGCMARSTGKDIFEKMPHVDLIVSPSNLHKIPDYVEKIINSSRSTSHVLRPSERSERTSFVHRNLRIIDLEDNERVEGFYSASYRAKPGSAQVVISTGCSNYCSYCVVPYVRDELRLRRPRDIIAEVKRNVVLGRTKITLLGQNVNDYKYRNTSHVTGNTFKNVIRDTCDVRHVQVVTFVDLLKMVEVVDGVEQIDFLTPHPKNTSKELLKLMAKSKKIVKYLHLPYQSGSDRILKLMHRGYTRKEYLTLVEDYKNIVGGTVGTDIIVGFPTETDEDFNHTKEVLEKARFMGAYIFKYSPRPGTAAARLEDDVPQKVKEKRHNILLELQKEISRGNK
jgi:tRNA-2-methylthio-N6-dimethylallyladenosine synthase